jgi:hypothetical protein
MDGEQEFREEEVARTVVASRIKELRRWLENVSAHLERATLYELETDLQVIETLAGTTAKQLLRVLKESGMLRQAAHRAGEQVDEVGAQRDTHRDP